MISDNLILDRVAEPVAELLQLDLFELSPEASDLERLDKCDCKYGFISLAYEAPGFCCGCGIILWSIVPNPPEVLGYESARWADWKRLGRYPTKVVAQFTEFDHTDC